MSFAKFHPGWKDGTLWAQWKAYSRFCFGTGVNKSPNIFIRTNTADNKEEDRNNIEAQAKTIKTPINITTDDGGEPEIPSITQASGYHTKVVQTTLRNYCNAHIRKSDVISMSLIYQLHICVLGFISGKKKAIIPWAKVVKNPTAWISEECYPEGFHWADPSKIRVKKVFELFEHWRQRRRSGLPPISWNPSCNLLADVDQSAEDVHIRMTKRSEPNLERDSDEEDFSGELAGINENDSESQSAHRLPEGSLVSEPDDNVTQTPSIKAPPPVPLPSCESIVNNMFS
jgi:hypothetical protein